MDETKYIRAIVEADLILERLDRIKATLDAIQNRVNLVEQRMDGKK